MIYKARVKNPKYYYDDNNWAKTKEQWLEIDPAAQFQDISPSLQDNNNPIGIDNISIYSNRAGEGLSEANWRQVGRQVGDKLEKNWGELSRKFDDFMRENKGDWVNKKDVADMLETSYKDKGFQKLLLRRRTENPPKIIVHGRNPDLIRWINREFEVTDLSAPLSNRWIKAKLPFDLDTRLDIPKGSVGVVAGFKDAGKTAFFLELAETVLLSTDLEVWYFYNEFTQDRLRIRVEDFPVLVDMHKKGRFFPVRQDTFEVKDILRPDACTIYDYLRRTEDFYLHAGDIDALAKSLVDGMIWVGLQKTNDAKTGYGGTPTRWLANIYLTLDVVKNLTTGIEGKIAIQDAKDYRSDNPKGESLKYKSGGKHGRLFRDGIWGRG